jgi:hypothetical protein
MNHRAEVLAYISALLLAVGACGGDAPSPEPAPAPVELAKEESAPRNDSPVSDATAALASDLSLD